MSHLSPFEIYPSPSSPISIYPSPSSPVLRMYELSITTSVRNAQGLVTRWSCGRRSVTAVTVIHVGWGNVQMLFEPWLISSDCKCFGCHTDMGCLQKNSSPPSPPLIKAYQSKLRKTRQQLVINWDKLGTNCTSWTILKQVESSWVRLLWCRWWRRWIASAWWGAPLYARHWCDNAWVQLRNPSTDVRNI